MLYCDFTTFHYFSGCVFYFHPNCTSQKGKYFLSLERCFYLTVIWTENHDTCATYFAINFITVMDPSYKCHKALDKYPTMQTCTHFCNKMVHCRIWDWCIVGFVQQVYCTLWWMWLIEQHKGHMMIIYPVMCHCYFSWHITLLGHSKLQLS